MIQILAASRLIQPSGTVRLVPQSRLLGAFQAIEWAGDKVLLLLVAAK